MDIVGIIAQHPTFEEQFEHMTQWNWRALDKWSGNTGPLLTIAASETEHAHFSNRLRGSCWWKAGPESIVEDTVIQKHRGGVSARLKKDRQAILVAREKADPRATKKRNQYSQTSSKIVPSVSDTVDQALRSIGRKYLEPDEAQPRKRRAFHKFHAERMAVAKAANPATWNYTESTDFMAESVRLWATMADDLRHGIHKDVQAEAKRQTSTPWRGSQKSRLSDVNASAPVPDSTYGIGSDCKPIVGKHIDEYIDAVERWDAKPGKYSGGLATLYESGLKYPKYIVHPGPPFIQ